MNYMYVTDKGYLHVTCDFENKDIVTKAGGQWNSKSKNWTVAFTSQNIEYLLDNIPDMEITQELQTQVESLLAKEDKLDEIKKLAKEDKKIDFIIPGWNKNMPPYNYQKLGIMFSIENGQGVLLADDMGLGKTLQALGTAVYKKHTEGMKSCLIITPASVKWNWPLEIEKFTNEKYVIIDGTPAKREEQWLREDVFFYVANYELIVEDLGAGKEVKIKASDTAEQIEKKELKKIKSQQRARKLAPVARRNWGMISVDECHMMKSHRSKRTEAIKGLTTDFKLGLTGTPMDGRLEEIHSIMEWICPGLFMSKHRFMLKHASTDFWGRVTGYHDIDIVKEKIAPFFLRRLKRDVLKDLPEKIYVNRYVKLSPKELKTYKQIAKREHEVTEDDEAIVAAIRCKQFCDFPNWVIEDEKYANTKLESFKELLEEVVVLGCHKTIVFSQYTTMCEELIKIIEEMKLKYYYICGDTNTKERVDMCEDFNTNPQMDVIIGTEAMSTGLNITGATYVINYDDNWSPAFMKQREDRAYRNGQKNAVTVVNFICKDTIEERIRTALYEKDKVSNETLGDESDMATLKRMTQDEIFGLL